MPTQRGIDDFLHDIVEWSRRIETHIEGSDFERFRQDLKTQDAVIRCLEVLGEASAQFLKLDPDFQNKHPELELRQAYRARNRTAHGYGSVSLDTIWASAKEAAPRLGSAAKRILHD